MEKCVQILKFEPGEELGGDGNVRDDVGRAEENVERKYFCKKSHVITFYQLYPSSGFTTW